MQLISRLSTASIFLGMCLAVLGCVTSGPKRSIFYRESLRPYRIIENLHKGDSIVLHLGDSIPFKYSKHQVGYEKGHLLITRNKFNRIEYYEFGEWTDERKDGLIQKAFFDKQLGLISHTQWYRIDQKTYLLSDSKRVLKNDSLIQTLEWYHGNGKLHSRITYWIRRGYNERQRDLEKEVELRHSVFFDEFGNPTKRKRYKQFKVPAD